MNDENKVNCVDHDLKFKYKHLWKYFKLHAKQRIASFRFYVVLLVFFLFVAAVFLGKFSLPGYSAEILVIMFGVAFFLITFVFHSLERRDWQLMHYAEDGLRELESKLISDDPCHIFKIMTREKMHRCHGLRHSNCFLIVYIFGYVVSVLLILCALAHVFMGI